MTRRLLGLCMPPLVALALICLVWQLVALHNRSLIPTLPQIFSELSGHPGLYGRDLLVTLNEVAVGAGCGMAAAFVLAVAMSELPVLERALMPLAVALNVTPLVGIAPGLVVAFGFGMTPKYVLTGVIVFFPFLVNVLIGLRSADPESLTVLRSLHASRWDILFRLRLPGSLPFLFAALRVCLPLSVIGAIVAEFSAPGRDSGLGALIQTGASLSDLKTVYASVLILVLLGIVLTLLVVLLQRRFLSWHHSGLVRG